ncbi:MAG: AAA family ATPase [Bryobacteraceae bacterium]|nr:AAA family ATPase [Bryobacteraceae bacterium]
MRHFTRLSVTGFRRLSSIEVELRDLAVLIGANGSGKSSILDVLSLLSRSAKGELAKTLQEHGGLLNILTAGSGERLNFDITCSAGNDDELEYLLSIAPAMGGAGHEVSTEWLRGPILGMRVIRRNNRVQYPRDGVEHLNDDEIQMAFWKLDLQETALSQVPRNHLQAEQFRSTLASSAHYHDLDVSARSPVRLPQMLRPGFLPGPQAEDLVSCLFNLRESHQQRFEALQNAVRAGFPQFERFEFVSVSAGTIALGWKEHQYSRSLFMNQLSGGTLRFLWLATILLSPDLPALTLIDEPEVSLHPELLSIVADLLRDAAERSQVIVATHSDRLVRFLKPEEVITVDLEEGSASLRWADTLDLNEWLTDYTLDELWMGGHLGGRS